MTNTLLFAVNAALTLVAIGLAVYAAITLRRVGRIRSSFSDHGKPVDLEEVLGVLATKIKNLERGSQTADEQIIALRQQLATTVQHVGLVRFNSFADEGGNLSFACALLDEHNTGVVFTSMHGRQQNRIYAKKITNGVSEAPLSEEERQAINQH